MAAITVIPVYLMYSFPAILFYGVITSWLSDKAAEMIAKKSRNMKLEPILSAVLHLAFGLILLWYSLAASILFFIVDRILKRIERDFWWDAAIKSFALPMALWVLTASVVWWNG
ncbi:hypothetical protein [Bacillus sp. FJAT-27225]|uniref:hypothetical protein n=1 Tax=Bacillus sp. FJAT-27225 TaxID=1743144 RepID=UPI0020C765B8|nr:hypothetical protein [Bacillus sp. FJAT-27225]